MSSNQELPAINGNNNKGEPPCKKAKYAPPTLEDLPASLIVHTMTFCEPKELASCRRFSSGIPGLLKDSPFDFCETHRVVRHDGKCGYCERGVDLCNFCDQYRPIKELKQCGALDRHGNECNNNICGRHHDIQACIDWYCGAMLCPDVDLCKVGYYTGCALGCQTTKCSRHIRADLCCNGDANQCPNGGGYVCCEHWNCQSCGLLYCGQCECSCDESEMGETADDEISDDGN